MIQIQHKQCLTCRNSLRAVARLVPKEIRQCFPHIIMRHGNRSRIFVTSLRLFSTTCIRSRHPSSHLYFGISSAAEGAFDRAILSRSAAVKSGLYGGRLFVIVPIYVTSICSEQCVYCNYRAGNKGLSVEAQTIKRCRTGARGGVSSRAKGHRGLELVYASDPLMRVDAMCRHVELLRRVLDRRGGGLVAISAESLEEKEYRRLVNAGLSISVLWQETYDKARYSLLHPGKTRKTDFTYRLDAYERMLVAGIPHVGMGVLLGLAEWKRDWAMLMLHEEYLRRQCGRGVTILGTPRLKHAPGALLHESRSRPTGRNS